MLIERSLYNILSPLFSVYTSMAIIYGKVTGTYGKWYYQLRKWKRSILLGTCTNDLCFISVLIHFAGFNKWSRNEWTSASFRLAILLKRKKPANPIRQIVTTQMFDNEASQVANLSTRSFKFSGVIGSFFFWILCASIRFAPATFSLTTRKILYKSHLVGPRQCIHCFFYRNTCWRFLYTEKHEVKCYM